MPTAKSVKDDTEPAPQPPEAAAPAVEEPATVEPSGPKPGVYEFTHYGDCVYPHVPLSARAARPARPATDDDPGEPARAATVFDWPFGPPDDGRWAPTKKSPNQAADNMPPLSSKE